MKQSRVPGSPGAFRKTLAAFGNYLKQLVGIGLSSSLALGIIVGLLLLIVGETTAEFDLTLEFGALDGIWIAIALPILTILVGLIISPLSFAIHRLASLRSKDRWNNDD